MAELQFFTGTMDSGKSTLALQTNHNHASRGRVGRIFTSHDRAGVATLSSRLGLTHDAIEVPGSSSEADSCIALPSTKVTAMVSPKARPRPRKMPPITAERV